MIIDLKQVFVNDNFTLPLKYAFDLSHIEYMGEYPLKKPVEIAGEIVNKASVVRLEAEISFEFDASCDRCGARTAKTHTLKVSKSLATSIEGEDSDTIVTVPDMKFNLDEFLYAEVITNLPMKHLCSESCKGLCVKCGKNLNEGECGCQRKEIDPRLSALADLLK